MTEIQNSKQNVCVRLCVSACPVECEAYSSGVANLVSKQYYGYFISSFIA